MTHNEPASLAEWRARRDGGWTTCSCPARHRGCCSAPIGVEPARQLGLFGEQS